MVRNFEKHNGSDDNFLSRRFNVTVVKAIDETKPDLRTTKGFAEFLASSGLKRFGNLFQPTVGKFIKKSHQSGSARGAG